MPYKPLVSKIRVHNPNRKGSTIANRNYVTYIATREGVALDAINGIDDLLKNDKILESNLNEQVVHQEAGNEGYLRYMAKRPRSHGLFGNIETEDLGEVTRKVGEVSNQGRIIYRGIISLSKEDGEELGFKNTKAWYNYMQRVMPDIAQKLGVSVTDHTWVAAFHAEESHPHVHYELWDNKDKVKSPFIHVSVQKSIRNMLSDEMFDSNYEKTIRNLYQNQLNELKKNRNEERSSILKQSTDMLREIGYVPGVEYEKLPDKIKNADLKEIADETNKLISMLPNTGRITYKFLSPEAKEQLTVLTNRIMSRIDVQRELSKYLSSIEDMHTYYGETKTEIKNAKIMGKADIEKRVKNALLKEIKNSIIERPIQDVQCEVEKKNVTEETQNVINEVENGIVARDVHNEVTYYIDWNDKYKSSMQLLYGQDKDISKAFSILDREAIKGNAIAIDKVAKLIEKNLIDSVEVEQAEEYFTEARVAYNEIYNQSDDKYKVFYAAYREGKLYDMGKGGEQDYINAQKWYQAAGDNKFAQYSLGKLYLDNKVVLSENETLEKNYQAAFSLFKSSSKSGNPFASYEMGNMYAKGLGVGIDKIKAEENYKIAYKEFASMIEKTTDDNLLYRVGKMTYYGMGIEANHEKAVPYFEKAANVGNENAQFMLAKIYIDQKEPQKVKIAMDILQQLAEKNNLMAQYRLGAIYADAESPYYDMEKAMEYLERAAAQENQFAEYKLGAIYADAESPYYDMEKAMEYLERAAAQENQFAEYKLGKIYLEQGKYYDIKKAIEYLERSAKQENQYAKYSLGMYYTNVHLGAIDLEKAKEYFSKYQDDKFVQVRLANIYLTKDYGHYNVELGISYLTKAAEQGLGYAQAKLGAMYYFGNSMQLNKAEGEKWLSRAAEQGNQFAKDILNGASYNIGISYALVKAALASIEEANQQNISKQNNLYRTNSKQAHKEKQKHQDHKQDAKGKDFIPEQF